jgi:tRNA A-37 threonylcarbamoyl transferase component Bud32
MTGDLRWTRTAAGRQLLTDDDLDLERHRAAGRVTVVKHGQHRSVYRVTLPTGDVVYWKHCRLNGPRAWWRDFFRGPKARLEFDRARALAERGVETVEPLAWARFRGRWPRGSFLITRALVGTVPLDEQLIHTPPATAADRRRLTVALAEFVSKLHAAGVTHPDLHPGNLLVRTDGGKFEFFLIDVHDVKLGPPLDRAARLRNLTILNRWFQLRTTRADRLRFWRAYAGPEADEAGAKRLERETNESVVSLWASRDRRCLRENRHFRRARGPGVTGFAVRDLDPDVVAGFVQDPDGPFAGIDAELLKASRSATVCVVTVPTSDGPRPMVYKRFRVTHRTDFVAALFRQPPALRSWLNGHALIDRGLPTPRPWLVLHRTRFGLPGVGYLLCDLVPDARHLHDCGREARPAEKSQLIDRLARWVRLMHERGVAHRDLKAANVLVTGEGDCQFIDLVGARNHREVPLAARVRDLGRLNASFLGSPSVSRADRLRFLRTYLAWGVRGRGDWKGWWNRVFGATEEKVRRNERNRRPLT